MGLKEFRKKYETFLRESNVNLGRNSKNKDTFIATAIKMVTDFALDVEVDVVEIVSPEPESKPRKKSKSYVTTAEDSRRADEQLGRAPDFG